MTDEISTVRQYFDRLAEAFAGSDPAVAQDATYDAQEFLAGERQNLAAGGEEDEAALVRALRSGFGEPEEVVESYQATEAQVAAALAPPRVRAAESWGQRIFGVLVEPRSYGALFFLLLSLPLGILYFVWAVTGLSLSAGLAILVFGFLFFLFFVSTVRAAAVMECRIVETLLGERMPRRPAVVPPRGGWLQRLGYWIRDGRTWLTILYMILRMPLGIVYFTLATVLLSIALSLMAAPFVQLFLDFPLITIMSTRYYLPLWLLPVFLLAGVFDLLVLMHAARAIGRFHAGMAKSMLARPGI
ncbi:MAG: sensor domain-containing protein [Thermoanaerobaculia bacterium]|nr:sensor domain-containing protein [Thermoanaerobaculia bacterium]